LTTERLFVLEQEEKPYMQGLTVAFHDVDVKDMPPYGEFCLLELKDGRYTAGEWTPEDYNKAECLRR